MRNDNTGFFDDSTRTIIQRAFFASADYEIIPKKLIFTAGTRYYHFDEEQLGGANGSFGCKVFCPKNNFSPCTTGNGSSFNAQNPNGSTYDGFRSRANLSWHITDDALLYYTWSQGFRPGGFNRGSSKVQVYQGQYQYATPYTYSPDTLTNSEVGFKTEWLNHRLQVNGAIYQEDWKNTIVEFFDPQGGFGNLTFVTNGPNYRVRGGELQVVTRVTEGLTVQGSASYNRSTQSNSPALLNTNPVEPEFRQADPRRQRGTDCQRLRAAGQPARRVASVPREYARSL